jgi:serine protease Do
MENNNNFYNQQTPDNAEENNNPNVADFQSVSEPTVTFDAVKDEKKDSSTGIKVFFAMLAVVVMLVAAVAVGYVFGKSDYYINNHQSSTPFQNKADAEATDSITVYNNVSPSVVNIFIYNEKGAATASGVVYTSDGYIVTNDHIYSEISSPRFLVVFSDGKEYEAEFIAGDARSDVAVLKADTTELTPAEFGDSNSLVVGERSLVIGFSAKEHEKAILTSGVISSVSRRVVGSLSSYSSSLIQTDSAVNLGSSGGALANEYGQVIGIISSKYIGEEVDSVGFAIHSNTALNNANPLIRHGYVKGRAKLGISYTEQSEAMTNMDPSITMGLKIAAISEDSPFAALNVEVGDVITAINDEPIVNSSVILDVVDKKRAGDTILVTVKRAKTATIGIFTITLAEDKGGSSYQLAVTGNPSTEIK